MTDAVQNENAQEIMKLRVLIGKDGDALFWQYGAKQNYTEAKLKENQHNHKTQEKINEVKERHSIFPEMEKSERNISLGYGDGKVLANQHHFHSGDLYENTTKWTAPTKRKYLCLVKL